MVAKRGPAKPGAYEEYAICSRKSSHTDAYDQANQDILRYIMQCQTQKREWQVKDDDIEGRYHAHGQGRMSTSGQSHFHESFTVERATLGDLMDDTFVPLLGKKIFWVSLVAMM